MSLFRSMHATQQDTAATIPMRSYQDYSSSALQRIFIADQWLPVFAFFYIFIVASIYLYQCCRRFYKFDPRIIPIHQIGLLCLFASLLYCALLFLESHSNQLHTPFFESCLSTQRIHLIALVIVKYTTTWTWIFNLSYMNQSPFFNPRYKYITKKRRKFLHYLFLAFKWIIAVFLPLGIFSAYRRTQCESFQSSPDNFTYCYMTFDLKNFFFIFGTDILGIILYGLLFGRNACKCTARKIKKHEEQPDVNPADFATSSHYDLDDPIQKSLLVNSMTNSAAFNSRFIQDRDIVQDNAKHDDDRQRRSSDGSHSATTSSHTEGSTDSDGDSHDSADANAHHHEVERNRTMHRSMSSRNISHKTRSHKASLSSASLSGRRESAIISGAQDNVKLLEENGVRELTRVLRLVWFMLIFYWLNVLCYVFLGLYTSSASVALIVNATCILLLNDYEFSSTYWSVRSSISACLCCCCIVGCGCWFGQRKHSIVHHHEDYEEFYYDDDTVYSKQQSNQKQYADANI